MISPRRLTRLRRVSGEQGGEGCREGWSGGAQFGAVVDREVAQDGRACGRESDDDAAAVGIVPLALHEALPGGAVDQFDGAVVVQQQAIREVADGHRLIVGEAAQGQEELVLLRLKSGLARRLLAEMEEAAEAIAEFGQGLVLGVRNLGAQGDAPCVIHIVLRYILADVRGSAQDGLVFGWAFRRAGCAGVVALLH